MFSCFCLTYVVSWISHSTRGARPKAPLWQGRRHWQRSDWVLSLSNLFQKPIFALFRMALLFKQTRYMRVNQCFPSWRWTAEQVLPCREPCFRVSNFPELFSLTTNMTTTWSASSLATRIIKTSTHSRPQWPGLDRFAKKSRKSDQILAPGLLEADPGQIFDRPPLDGVAGGKDLLDPQLNSSSLWGIIFLWEVPRKKMLLFGEKKSQTFGEIYKSLFLWHIWPLN